MTDMVIPGKRPRRRARTTHYGYRIEPDWEMIHYRMQRGGTDKLQLWQEYKQKYGPTAYCYKWFCEIYGQKYGVRRRESIGAWRLRVVGAMAERESKEMAAKDAAIRRFYGVAED